MMMPTKPSPQRPAPRTQTSNHRSQYFEQHHNEQSSLQATATNWQPHNSSQAFSQPSSFSRPLTSDQIDGNQFGSNSLRYVNVRVVIPADTPTDHVAGYVHSRLLMQQQREVNYDFQTGITPSAGPPSHYHVRNSNHGFSNMRPSDNSHYEFVPINTNMTSANLRHQYNDQRPFRGSSSPFSPIASNSMYSFEKGSPSPSMLTLDTAEMTESSCYSSFSTPASSRICSPAGSGFMISPPLVKAQQQRSSSATSFQSSVGSSSCCSGPFKSLVSSSENNGNTKNGRRSPAYINGRKSPAKIGSANGSSEDDEVRKCRIKTEMCLHYINGTTCPFGTNCTYAHGEEELQMTKLIDLHEAGLVDMDTYRIKPCLTWVATGSCPFGKRCICIHDPRLGSSQPSWLPHTETQGNTIATDINVEAIHQKRLNTILYNNPFGIEALVPPQASSTNTRSSISHQWRLLYNLTTDANLKPNTEGWMTDNKHLRRSLRLIDPIVKLQIAIRMREETTSDWLYKYRPQHFIYGEFCMVLTKRAFRIASRDGTKRKMRNHRTANKVGGDVEVVEIPLSAYNPDMLSHVVAREIAFGPDCDPSVRGVSLWFHIDEEDVTVCTPQQAKRFRWKKGIKPNKNELDATDQNRAVNAGQKPSAFDSQAQLESFPMLRPQDPDAYDLVTDILKHRLAVLRAERICSMKERFESLKHLESKKCDLQLRFEHMQRTWTSWAWPVNIGREFVDRRTPVPAVDGFYKINDPKICSGNEAATSILIQNTGIVDDPDNSDNIGVQRGTIIPRIWTSFVATISPESLTGTDTHHLSTKSGRRLKFFEQLADGQRICGGSCGLPHIKRNYLCSTDNDSNNEGKDGICNVAQLENQKERCWKALLLEPSEETGIVVNENSDEPTCLKTEWDIVLDHFENSRSKKVLSIIQQ